MSVSQASDKVASYQSASSVRAWDAPPVYDRLHSAFTWQVPEQFNMAQACCARWAALPEASKKIAVYSSQPGTASRSYSFAELQDQANRLANVLARMEGAAR